MKRGRFQRTEEEKEARAASRRKVGGLRPRGAFSGYRARRQGREETRSCVHDVRALLTVQPREREKADENRAQKSRPLADGRSLADVVRQKYKACTVGGFRHWPTAREQRHG